MTRNLHWYTRNESRPYPLSDAATGISTADGQLPNNIIADLNLRFPLTLGDYPFIASIAVTKTLVSVTIQCATDPHNAATFAPVAAISLPLADLVPYQHYPLEAQYPGAGGWIVFGEGAVNGADGDTFTGRFDSPAAALLSPRAARAYQPLPVTSLSKLYDATALTGIVTLKGDDPVDVVIESREIEGVLRDVVVVRLVQPAISTSNLAPEVNVFSQFAGPCNRRPESGNCGETEPIEFINAVPPDCRGNLTVEFHGCAIIAAVQQECGVMLDCGLGLVDACVAKQLPGPDGKLSNEYNDLCNPSVVHHSENLGVIGGGHGEIGPGGVSEFSQSLDAAAILADTSFGGPTSPGGTLPYLDTFDDGVAHDFFVISGAFTFAADDPPDELGTLKSYSTENARSKSQRNLSLWEGFDTTVLDRTFTCTLKMLQGGTKNNAGFVLNYRRSPDFVNRFVYFLVEIDYDTQMLRVMRFNGTQFIPEPAFAQLTNLQLNIWYRLTVNTEVGAGSNVLITVTLEALSGATLTATVVLTTNHFMPDNGRVGFHADRAWARFGYLKVDDNA